MNHWVCEYHARIRREEVRQLSALFFSFHTTCTAHPGVADVQIARNQGKRAEQHGIASASGNAGSTATPQRGYLLYTEYGGLENIIQSGIHCIWGLSHLESYLSLYHALIATKSNYSDLYPSIA